VNHIEVMVEGASQDGMAQLSSRGKTTPAPMMTAAEKP
jgi:hypothetical protein